MYKQTIDSFSFRVCLTYENLFGDVKRLVSNKSLAHGVTLVLFTVNISILNDFIFKGYPDQCSSTFLPRGSFS